MEIEDLLFKLDRDIKRYRIDFERFFSGNLPIPPDQLRIQIQDQIKFLRGERIKAVADRFRLNGSGSQVQCAGSVVQPAADGISSSVPVAAFRRPMRRPASSTPR